MVKTVRIEGLGIKGDGVAADGHFVLFTLPGELVTSGDGEMPEILEKSPHRIDAVCQHFGTCGGCALQHIEQREYLQWKRQRVVDAFEMEGLDPEVSPCLPVEAGQRRRAVFSVAAGRAGVTLGFQTRRSHDVIGIEECPVLENRILEKLNHLNRLARLLQSTAQTLRISVLTCNNGLDVSLEASGQLDGRKRNALIEWALEAGIARLTVDDEVILLRAQPELEIDGIKVLPPPGGFAQAVQTAENHMTDLAIAHLEKCKNIADLFSGFGTFALPLARQSNVHAVEYERPSLDALQEAADNAPGLKRVSCEQRDLIRRPLQTAELEQFDGVLFDPPRAGAEEQADELAASRVKRIVAVSCNPTTLARDARILVEGGYRLAKVHPVDQFLFSPHVEVVALFEKKKTRGPRKVFG